MRRLSHIPSSLLVVYGKECGTHPRSMVEFAEKKKRAQPPGASFDEIWLVFDRDDHDDLEGVFSKARSNKFKIAFSNPCFEPWLLLHFRLQTGFIHGDRVMKQLKEHLPNYDKFIDYETLKNRESDAVKRAEALCKSRSDEGSLPDNPYTDVHGLVQKIQKVYPKIR